eukprot:g3096.t1
MKPDSPRGSPLGVQITLVRPKRQIVVEAVALNSPADRAGFMEEDIIVSIAGRTLQGFRMPDVVGLLPDKKERQQRQAEAAAETAAKAKFVAFRVDMLSRLGATSSLKELQAALQQLLDGVGDLRERQGVKERTVRLRRATTGSGASLGPLGLELVKASSAGGGGEVSVRRVHPGGAAEGAIHEGEVLVRVGGLPVRGLDMDRIVELLRKQGRDVELVMRTPPELLQGLVGAAAGEQNEQQQPESPEPPEPPEQHPEPQEPAEKPQQEQEQEPSPPPRPNADDKNDKTKRDKDNDNKEDKDMQIVVIPILLRARKNPSVGAKFAQGERNRDGSVTASHVPGNSRAAKGGLRTGDAVIKINGKDVAAIKMISQVHKFTKLADPAVLVIHRRQAAGEGTPGGGHRGTGKRPKGKPASNAKASKKSSSSSSHSSSKRKKTNRKNAQKQRRAPPVAARGDGPQEVVLVRPTDGTGLLGLEMGQDTSTGSVLIRRVKAGSAADKAGLVGGEEILEIGGKPAKGVPMDQVAALLKREGDKVRLVVAAVSGRVGDGARKPAPGVTTRKLTLVRPPGGGPLGMEVALREGGAGGSGEAVVVRVGRGSAAAKGGLRKDDVIIEIAGRAVKGLALKELHQLLQASKKEVALVVHSVVEATNGDDNNDGDEAAEGEEAEEEDPSVTVEVLHRGVQIGARFGRPGRDQQIVIKYVRQPSSRAAEAGLRVGDVVVSINGVVLNHKTAVGRLTALIHKKDPAVFHILRAPQGRKKKTKATGSRKTHSQKQQQQEQEQEDLDDEGDEDADDSGSAARGKGRVRQIHVANVYMPPYAECGVTSPPALASLLHGVVRCAPGLFGGPLPRPAASQTPLSVAVVALDSTMSADGATGCTPLTASDEALAAGKALLVLRGNCPFTTKASVAQAAGAAALVIVNNDDGPPMPIFGLSGPSNSGMSYDDDDDEGADEVRIPLVMVMRHVGLLLAAAANGPRESLLLDQAVGTAGGAGVGTSSRAPVRLRLAGLDKDPALVRAGDRAAHASGRRVVVGRNGVLPGDPFADADVTGTGSATDHRQLPRATKAACHLRLRVMTFTEGGSLDQDFVDVRPYDPSSPSGEQRKQPSSNNTSSPGANSSNPSGAENGSVNSTWTCNGTDCQQPSPSRSSTSAEAGTGPASEKEARALAAAQRALHSGGSSNSRSSNGSGGGGRRQAKPGAVKCAPAGFGSALPRNPGAIRGILVAVPGWDACSPLEEFVPDESIEEEEEGSEASGEQKKQDSNGTAAAETTATAAAATGPPDVRGRIVVVRRGGCLFDAKLRLAQAAGAAGLIVANIIPRKPIFAMELPRGATPEEGRSLVTPALMVSSEDGDRLFSVLGNLTTAARATSTTSGGSGSSGASIAAGKARTEVVVEMLVVATGDEEDREEQQRKVRAEREAAARQRKRQEAARARHQKQAAAAEDRSPVHITVAYPGGGVQIERGRLLGAGQSVRPQNGELIRLERKVELVDVLTGVNFTVRVPRRRLCPRCHGRSALPKHLKPCPGCTTPGHGHHGHDHGHHHHHHHHDDEDEPAHHRRTAGIMGISHMLGSGFRQTREVTCPVCGGHGELMVHRRHACPHCGGRRVDTIESPLFFVVPPGVVDGHVIMLRGRGHEKPLHRQGDVLCQIRVAKHPDFERVGDDLTGHLQISLAEALAGFTREVKLLNGTAINVTRVGYTAPGHVEVVSGAGLPLRDMGAFGRDVRGGGGNDDGRGMGDLRLLIGVTMPNITKTLNRSTRAALHRAFGLDGEGNGGGGREYGGGADDDEEEEPLGRNV